MPHHHRLGAVAGPVSLLLLPKCPLCFASILAGVGVIVPGALGLSVVAGLVVGGWVVFLFLTACGRKQRAAAVLAGIVSLLGILLQIRPLLWIGVAAMIVTALLFTKSQLDNCGVERA